MNGLVQGNGISIANSMDTQHYWTKPLIYHMYVMGKLLGFNMRF